MTFGFLFQSTELDFMGGLIGKVMNDWLVGVFGQIGTGFFIVFSGFITIMILFNPSFTWVTSLFEKISSKLNMFHDKYRYGEVY